jgi:hypothetical protein
LVVLLKLLLPLSLLPGPRSAYSAPDVPHRHRVRRFDSVVAVPAAVIPGSQVLGASVPRAVGVTWFRQAAEAEFQGPKCLGPVRPNSPASFGVFRGLHASNDLHIMKLFSPNSRFIPNVGV